MDNFFIFLKSVKIEVNADCILILILISASQQFNEMKSVFHKHAFFTSHVCCKHPTVRHKLIGFFSVSINPFAHPNILRYLEEWKSKNNQVKLVSRPYPNHKLSSNNLSDEMDNLTSTACVSHSFQHLFANFI